MVVFTCNHCGDSLKKKDVEKHYDFRCKGKSIFVSCMDCTKDFKEDYEEHTKCITESEKYGKDFTPKQKTVSKEKKKAAWIECIKNIAKESKKVLHAEEKALLLSLAEMKDGVPMKQKQFCNFVRNGKCKCVSAGCVNSVWQLLQTAGIKNGIFNNSNNETSEDLNTSTKKTIEENDQENLKGKSKASGKNKANRKKKSTNVVNSNEGDDNKTVQSESFNGSNLQNGNSKNEMAVLTNLNENKPRTKKEAMLKLKRRKYEQELLAIKNEQNKNGVLNDDSSLLANEPVKKKVKPATEEVNETSEQNSTESKKKKNNNNNKKKDGNLNIISHDNIPKEEIKTEDNTGTGESTKFNWQEIIIKSLQPKGQLSLKKLEKKVVSEFLSSGNHIKSRKKLVAKFNKKVTSIPGVKVHKEIVKLVNTV